MASIRSQPGTQATVLPTVPHGEENRVLDMVALCASLARLASEVYDTAATSCPPGELKTFWSEMAEQCRQHAALWDRVEIQGRVQQLPPIFDDAGGVYASLLQVMERVTAICRDWQETGEVSDPFVVACRIELSMLHPTFATLFQFCRTWMGIDFYPSYEAHLNRFIEVLRTHEANKPELELLGEILQNLWWENRLLTQQATHDELTGLLNRRGFWLLARQSAYFSQRSGSHLGVLMLDLDNFRAVNERYGHPTGDNVLKSVASTLQKRLRKSDIVSRYGGEEFVVLCPKVDREALANLAESIRQSIERSQTDGIRVTVSIGAIEGAIESPSAESELNALIAKADNCLYTAKHSGKNTVSFHGGS